MPVNIPIIHIFEAQTKLVQYKNFMEITKGKAMKEFHISNKLIHLCIIQTKTYTQSY